VATLVIIVFLAGLLLISTEQRTGINKSAAALLTAGFAWVIVALYDTTDGSLLIEHLTESGAEIVEIVLFLLSAMALVEVIAHYQFFDVIKNRIFAQNFNTKKQLWIISLFAFFLSAVIDNLTTTIIFAQLCRLFFKGKNLVVATALVVIAANAGGGFSPIGDVTTTMLWLQEKFTSNQIIAQGIVPSIIMYLVAAFLLILQVKNEPLTNVETIHIDLSKSEKAIIIIAFGSFALPFLFKVIGLKPYLGLLVGLGLTWTSVDFCKRKLNNHASHFTATIENMLSKTDISSLMFFSGILLAVAALDHVGVLDSASHGLFGVNPSFSRLVAGSSILGVSSALVDNVPLTAAAMNIIKIADPRIWVLIAIAVGNGGSVLGIGSADGIVAMGINKEMTFTGYLKYATGPVLLAYICAIGAWYLQIIAFT
jgi:Na+/H+ antiporter NhaD/arsenite permease-like protein